MPVSKHVSSLSPGDNLAVVHGLGTRDVVVQVYGFDGTLRPAQVWAASDDQVNVTVERLSPTDGIKVVVIG